jgi:hypothetical protein
LIVGAVIDRAYSVLPTGADRLHHRLLSADALKYGFVGYVGVPHEVELKGEELIPERSST